MFGHSDKPKRYQFSMQDFAMYLSFKATLKNEGGGGQRTFMFEFEINTVEQINSQT